MTRKCQLRCSPCFNSSGPERTHGSMTREDWLRVLTQAAECGVRRVQLIGGEPTLHPDSRLLADRALSLGLGVEIYSNLVRVTEAWWALLQRDGMSLAASYYSDAPEEHNRVTGRPSHARTLANIKKAVEHGIPLRIGIVATAETQRVSQARRELEALGVRRINVDQIRPFGRGAQGRAPEISGLCGRCGIGRAAVGPDGSVSPCVFSANLLHVGNVRSTPLATILGSPAMAEARASIRSVFAKGGGDDEDNDSCDPSCDPNAECSPGYPGSECGPRN
ncbi:radical SAM/SPASM domain-containing protein [Streptomyces malaysiensis subsp. malaysiensis]|uniref:radical SAM/SPASM domain-containing protein n=1 Tax=Streptomyces malaysiensis TaxID=92644 RepID=UPI0024BF1176|nr:radical SAM/SPASM domain-containing protein [Streptomyces sp. NA07423]WHX24178.1 radical SAM/SPASM domain-containing protein [Streptomyces sp. NA07423]